MIESKVNLTPIPSPFPKLARARSDGEVVLFTSESCGTVVASQWEGKIGKHTDGYAHIDNTNIWEILPPGSQVVLTQK